MEEQAVKFEEKLKTLVALGKKKKLKKSVTF